MESEVIMGTKKGQVRKTARRAYTSKKWGKRKVYNTRFGPVYYYTMPTDNSPSALWRTGKKKKK